MNKFFGHKAILNILLICYTALFIFSAYEPSSRSVWIAEIIPVILILSIILIVSRRFTFSPTAYVLMFLWIALHTIGAKYTFANVPFDWFNDFIQSERNNFDRVAHFSIGFFAYPIAEYLYQKQYGNKIIAILFGLFAVMSTAAGYEIIEWWYSEFAGGNDGIAFLGSQGDIWDAQKDMLCDTLGALLSLVLFSIRNRKRY